ncbi:unnamed protein product, partial [Rhizoctonia solani]
MEVIERPPTNYSGSTELSDISSPEINHEDLTRALTPYTQGSFLDSIFSLAWSGDQPRRTSPQLTRPSQLDDDVDESDDLEEVQSAVTGFLALDQTVGSNGLPFVLQGCATWVSGCMFDPLATASVGRNEMLRIYVLAIRKTAFEFHYLIIPYKVYRVHNVYVPFATSCNEIYLILHV